MTDTNRTPNHTRTIRLDSYECDDGTIELELRLEDAKHFQIEDRERGTLWPGDPVHAMRARIRVTRELEVVDIGADLEAIPFSFCTGGAAHVPELVGKRLDRGWKREVRTAMGGIHGCTHLAELLALAPTLAFQTTAIPRQDEGKNIGRGDQRQTERPFFLGACHTWADHSPVVQRHFPQFWVPEDSDKG